MSSIIESHLSYGERERKNSSTSSAKMCLSRGERIKGKHFKCKEKLSVMIFDMNYDFGHETASLFFKLHKLLFLNVSSSLQM